MMCFPGNRHGLTALRYNINIHRLKASDLLFFQVYIHRRSYKFITHKSFISYLNYLDLDLVSVLVSFPFNRINILTPMTFSAVRSINRRRRLTRKNAHAQQEKCVHAFR